MTDAHNRPEEQDDSTLDEQFDEAIEEDDEFDGELDEDNDGEDDGDEEEEGDGEDEDEGTVPVIRGGNVPADETIGNLLFVANPEFPYPLNIPKPPRFWMEEQTGVLSDAVETYMRGDPLKPPQLAALKIYIKQFLERAPLTGDAKVGLLLSKLDRVRSTRDLENFADEAAEFGAEIF